MKNEGARPKPEVTFHAGANQLYVDAIANGNRNGLVFLAATISQLVPCAIQEQKIALED